MSFEADGFKVDGSAAGGTNAGTTDANTGTNADANKQSKEKDDEFFSRLNTLIGIVKDYWFKYGTFEFDYESGKTNSEYSIFINIFDADKRNMKENWLNYPTKTFKNTAKSKGFETEGCWRYIAATKKIYFFKCGEAISYGRTTKVQTFYRLNETPESLSKIAYTYGG
jgi:hypothetical protein